MTLRIERSVESKEVVFKLTGRIRVEDVPELQTLLRCESRECRIALDLEQVKLVDRDAVLFLALKEAFGIRLRNCSAYIRQWINQEIHAMGRIKAEGPAGFAG